MKVPGKLHETENPRAEWNEFSDDQEVWLSYFRFTLV